MIGIPTIGEESYLLYTCVVKAKLIIEQFVPVDFDKTWPSMAKN